jgi:hypothetical protein
MIPIVQQELIPASYRKGPDVTLPVRLLLDLHNAFPVGHEKRSQIRDYIREFASVNEKAHWSRAVVELENDDLAFDDGLWNIAVYRGKQESRMQTSDKAFKELREQLEFLSSFYEEECARIAEVKPIGKPVVDLPDPSPNLQHIRNHAEALQHLVERMHDGLSKNVAGTIEPPAKMVESR